MPRIFISYRRADSTAVTGRIYDRLVQAFGLDDVFKDVNDILGGHDFRHVLEQEVSQCDVLLVVIGPQWASTTDANGRPRLHDPADFVRIEVESGLKRDDVLVIPVLVDNATLPTKNDLPESLHDLVFRNAMTARNDPDFDGDMNRLIGQLRAHFRTLDDRPRIGGKSLGAIFVVLALLGIMGVVFLLSGDGDDPAVTPSSAAALSPTPTETLANEVTTTPTNSSDVTPSSQAMETITLTRVRVYSEPSQSASLIAVAASGTFEINGYSEDNTWIEIKFSETNTGWVQNFDVAVPTLSPGISVYFSRPEDDAEFETYVDQIEEALVSTIEQTELTLDIAAFEFNNPVLTDAIVSAYQRGVQVRILTDDEAGLEDPDTTIGDIELAGIGVVDDGRSALMHNSFMILDGHAVWTGNSSFTADSASRRNTSSIYIESEELANIYTTEFEEMYDDQLFGPDSPQDSGALVFAGDIPVQVFFAPEDDVLEILALTLDTADESIEFMMFSFTNDTLAEMMLELAASRGIDIRGIVEASQSRFGQMPYLVCNGIEILTDGNPGIMNHKIILIDGETVLAMSSSLSTSAMSLNDENIMIFTAPDIVAQYNAEFDILWSYAELPADVDCSTFED